MNDLRYPIGQFQAQTNLSQAQRTDCIAVIAVTPSMMREAVGGLTEAQLETPYRDGGWTVRQVVHHVPDSHMNAYTRFRLALTESDPAIKPYDEGAWAELRDAKTAPVELSLALLDALHARWVMLLQSMDEAAFQKSFQHPALGTVTLEKNLQLYAWHGRHHCAHITALRERMHWNGAPS